MRHFLWFHFGGIGYLAHKKLRQCAILPIRNTFNFDNSLVPSSIRICKTFILNRLSFFEEPVRDKFFKAYYTSEKEDVEFKVGFEVST